jgi:hypothetical protein
MLTELQPLALIWIKVLTQHQHADPRQGASRLGQGPTSATALVKIERYSGEASPISVFALPALAET